MEEWSSGCESGWTLYLNESSQSPTQCPKRSTKSVYDYQSCRANADDDEEDLSMVSDASSGPPHFLHYEEYGSLYPSSSSSSSAKSKKKKAEEPRTKNQHSFLDDTASSPTLINYPNRCMDQYNNQPSINHLFGFSQENGLMGNSAFGEQNGFWQSNYARQQELAEASRSRGRRRG